MKFCSLCSSNEAQPSHPYCGQCFAFYQRGRRRWIPETPEHRMKRLARKAASKALKRGTIVRQPCEVCGNPRAEMHHDDYAKRLEVRWLCDVHHHMEHNQRCHAESPVDTVPT